MTTDNYLPVNFNAPWIFANLTTDREYDHLYFAHYVNDVFPDPDPVPICRTWNDVTREAVQYRETGFRLFLIVHGGDDPEKLTDAADAETFWSRTEVLLYLAALSPGANVEVWCAGCYAAKYSVCTYHKRVAWFGQSFVETTLPGIMRWMRAVMRP